MLQVAFCFLAKGDAPLHATCEAALESTSIERGKEEREEEKGEVE